MKVNEETRIYLWDGVNAAAVYVGWLTRMELAKVKPNIEEIETGDRFEYLTLKEIADQVIEKYEIPSVTVITDGPLHGEIYHYGNHGDLWEKVGDTRGYA